MTSHVRNILSVYRSAEQSSVEAGMSWYDDAHAYALYLDPENVERAAGIIAALSPMSTWANNKRKAALTYINGCAAGAGLYSNVAKADRILAGEHPLNVLGGRKVTSFYLSIVDPSSTVAEPVIDRHAHDIAVGKVTNDSERQRLGGKGYYDTFAASYVRASKRVGITPKQLQAVTWVEWRNRLGKSWAG
jgi:hypothetical protein